MNSGEAYISLADYASGIAELERARSCQAHSFTPLLSTLAGDDWRKGSEGIFTQVWTNGDDPQGEAGYKIRMAANSLIADDVLRAAVPIIVEAGCPFKVIANTALLEFVGAKCASDDPAGDFLTIFPPTQTVFDDLAGSLRQAVQAIKKSPVAKPVVEPATRAPLTSENPWPGLDYYLPGEGAFYFGREDDQREFGKRLEQSVITVVAGQAAVGKSSFARAGLKPVFDRLRCEPIYLRVRHDREAQPVQQVRDEINRVLAERRIDGAPFGEGETLRDYFQPQKQGWLDAERRPVVPVLVFDQFEEFLTLDEADGAARRPVEAFWTQMANLVGNRARESTGQLHLPSFEPGSGGTPFRVIITLRQDQLPKLLARRSQIPAISQNHFILKPFNGSKAVEAVLRPGKHLLNPADAEALAERVVRGVAGETTQSPEKPGAGVKATVPVNDLTIDLALLNFFCQQLNEARKRSERAKDGNQFINARLIEAETGRIFESFLQPRERARSAPVIAQPQAAVAVSEREAPVDATEAVVQIQPRESKTQVQEAEPLIPVPAPEPPGLPITAESQIEVLPVESAVAAQTFEPLILHQAPEPETIVHAPELQAVVHAAPAVMVETPEPEIPAEIERKEAREEIRPERQTEASAIAPIPASGPTRTEKRLMNVLVALGMVAALAFAALFFMYLDEIKRGQTEVELEEYISNLAAARNTFQLAHKKLSFAESDLALKESNLLALIEQTREQEHENEAEKEQNTKLSGEQATYETRIKQLNSEKAQAEFRFAQWSSLLAELTNQIASLTRQNDDLEARNHVLAVDNRVLSATNAVLSAFRSYTAAGNEAKVTNSSQGRAPSSASPEDKQAAAMTHFPENSAAAIAWDPDNTRRNVDILLIHGECLYSDGGIGLHPLEIHHVLRQGAIIQTGKDSWCDLFVRRAGTMVRVAPETQVKVAKLSLGTENGFPVVDTLLVLPHGRIFTIVRAMVPGSTFEVSDGVERSVIEVGGLGSYMVSAPAPDFGDKLTITPLHLINQQGASLIAPGKEYTAKDGVVFSLSPSSWELTLLKLDEIEAEADKALAQQVSSKPQKVK